MRLTSNANNGDRVDNFSGGTSAKRNAGGRVGHTRPASATQQEM